MQYSYTSRLLVAALVLTASVAIPSRHAAAQSVPTIVVDATADVVDFAGDQQMSDLPGPDGRTTLREAVVAANNTPGPQTIAFNIPLDDPGFSGSIGVFVITLEQTSPLTLTDDGTTIDGSTQTAATGDTNPFGPEVNVSTTPINSSVVGLSIQSNGNTVRSLLGFGRFRIGIEIDGDGNRVVGCNLSQSVGASIRIAGTGNRIGGTAAGEGNTIRGSSDVGVQIAGAANVVEGNLITTHHNYGVSVEGTGNRIGGTTAASRNVIHGNGHTTSERAPVGANVRVGGSENLLAGNHIGVDATGAIDEGNISDGVVVTGTGHTIGGTEAGAGNVISGHNYAGTSIAHWRVGLDVLGSDVTVQGNRIGTDASGLEPLPNLVGIRVSGSNVLVGGSAPGAGNTIALNMRDGVALPNGAQTGVRISRNAIFGNGELGINLGFEPATVTYPATVTPNDAGDGDTGPNNLQNAPVVDSAANAGGGTFVTGHIDTPNPTTVTVELFSSGGADPSGFGEGQIFEGAVTPDTTGSFFVMLRGGLQGRYITATATAADGSTSELSNVEAVVGGVPPVLRVAFPNGGESWPAGTVRQIRWNTLGPVERVTVRVSFDGGAHYETIAANVENTGLLEWTVSGPASQNAIVTVEKAGDPSLRDASDAPFVVASPLAPRASTPGLYHSETASVFLRNTSQPGPADTTFIYGPALAGWTAIAGDWDGDGADSVGLYDPSSSVFFLKNSNGPGVADLTYNFGPAGVNWRPIAGDWNGDGIDTVGLYDPTTSTFFLRDEHAPGPADTVVVFGVGNSGYRPIAGDWNGDGVDTVGLYHPVTTSFFLRDANLPGPADTSFVYGPTGATPVAGDWDNSGDDTIGVVSAATWFLRNDNSPGNADLTFIYGTPSAAPLAGDWDGQ
jgi:hypothetical protein